MKTKQKMKSNILMVALLMAVLMIFAACFAAKGENYADGEYTGISSADDLGAYGEVNLTLKDGFVTACEYVTYQKDGTIKAEDYGKVNGEIENQDFYDKAQLAVKAMAQYADAMVGKNNPKDVDAVSGATNSYDQFQEAVWNALDEAAGK